MTATGGRNPSEGRQGARSGGIIMQAALSGFIAYVVSEVIGPTVDSGDKVSAFVVTSFCITIGVCLSTLIIRAFSHRESSKGVGDDSGQR